jgi:cytochrome c-type biogenesis protein CcsB
LFATISLVLTALLAPLALAQTAPAGNEQPTSRMLSEPGRKQYAFGTPVNATMDRAQKKAFARAIDLEPLRDLAVLHDGRVKILDSLARETVGTVCGRKDFIDYIHGANSTAQRPDVEAVKYDPLFTLIDLAIDPSWYVDKPLIGVNYLPLRTLFVERAVEGDEPRERWKRLGRITPEMIAKSAKQVSEDPRLDNQLQRALGQTQDQLELAFAGTANFDMLATDSKDKPWANLSDTPSDSPIAKACAALGAAWRAGDVATTNAAIKSLAAELPKVNAHNYPQGRRSLEAAYNRARPFEWGFWLYAGSLVSLLLAFGTQRPWLKWLGIALLTGAVSMHAFGFVARCIIAERFAIQNQFESMTGVSLFAAIIGLALAIGKRQLLFGAAVAAVGFMILVTATQTGIPGYSINREAAILNTSVLLKYHVTTVLFSYGLIALGMVTSVFYLVTHYAAKAKGQSVAIAGNDGSVEVSAAALGLDESAPKGVARVLSDLDKAQMTILQLAFWALGVGILLGAWWADHSWGRWWAFDPKELWALMTWIVYLIVIHVRKTGAKNPGLVTAWLSVLGFIVMLWCYFGVNLLLPGLHAYA